MTDEIEAITESSKAVQEVAKAAGKAIDLTGDLGAYLGKVVGGVPGDLVGLLGGDYLGQVRLRNLDNCVRKTKKIIEGRKAETEAVSLSIAVPLLRAAENESREELQDLWARLLANAMDRTRGNDIRPEFIETLTHFHPLDAVILQKITEAVGQLSPNARDFLKGSLNVSDDTVLVSIEKLVQERCLGHNNQLINPYPTPYGRELLKACRP
jgi:hypothetical protein